MKKIKNVEAVLGLAITGIITNPIIIYPILCVFLLPNILNSANAPIIKFEGKAIEFIVIFSINIVLV